MRSPWARENPELAILSVLAHGNQPGGLEVAVAALGAVFGLRGLDEERGVLYHDFVYAALNEAVRQASNL